MLSAVCILEFLTQCCCQVLQTTRANRFCYCSGVLSCACLFSALSCTADVHIGPSHHKELLQEVRAAAAHSALVREVHAVSDAAGAGEGDEDLARSPLVAQLKHVGTEDKAKPAIGPDAQVQKVSC